MFQITAEWLKQFGTKGIGYNQKQIWALGLIYPPKNGWKNSMIGQWITFEQKECFESFYLQSDDLKDRRRKLEAAKDYPVYRTEPDGKGSWTGRWLKPEEVWK